MGKSGPPRMPTVLLVKRGSKVPATRTEEPIPDLSAPDRPDWLLLLAGELWDRLVPQLEDMGVLGRCDSVVLERYCQNYAMWRGDVAWLRERDPEDGGYNQVGRRALALSDSLRKDERELGLTPAARAGLAKEKVNPLENRGKWKRNKEGA